MTDDIIDSIIENVHTIISQKKDEKSNHGLIEQALRILLESTFEKNDVL